MGNGFRKIFGKWVLEMVFFFKTDLWKWFSTRILDWKDGDVRCCQTREWAAFTLGQTIHPARVRY